MIMIFGTVMEVIVDAVSCSTIKFQSEDVDVEDEVQA